VREKLREGWSPEIISGRIGIDNPGYSIHHETIYSYIYARCNRRLHLEKYLTLKRRKRRRQRGRGVQTYSKIKNAISIEKRPKKVERRKEVGHWETDLMEGPRRSKVVVQANVERKTRFVVVSKSSGKTADTNSKLLITRLGKFPPKALKTITGDNGPENSDHQVVSKNLKVQFYFCHPYHSWEKGTGENTIGRLRRYIPKGVCIGKYSHKQIQQIEDRMNGTPRKCLNYLTPREALCKELKLNI
jgi:IS30 family transposase